MANSYTYELRLRDLVTGGLNRAKQAANSFHTRMLALAKNSANATNKVSTSISQLQQRLVQLASHRDNAFDKREITSYNQKIKETEVQLRKLQNLPPPTMMDRFRNMRSQLLGMIGISGGLATAMAGIGAVGGILKLGADAEQTRVSFQTMLGSVSKGNEMITSINKMGADTPFGNKELQDNTKLLLNMQVSANKVLPTLRMLGDVSGGNVEKLNGLTLAYSQVSSAGKLQGQDLMQMINAGFNPLNEISRVTGESMSSLKDKMSQGGISAKMIEMAFQSATSKGGMFYHMMDKQSQTLGGKWSTFTDLFMTKLSNMGESMAPFFGSLIDYATSASEVIMKVPSALMSMWHWLSQNKIAFYGLATILTAVVTGLLIYKTYTAAAALQTAWLNKETKIQVLWDKIVTGWTWAKNAALWAVSVATTTYTLLTDKAVLAQKAQAAWMGIVTSATWLWNTAQWALNAAFIANPIGLIIIAIAGLIAMIVLAVKKYESWGATLLMLMGPIGMFINAIMSIKRNWNSVVNAFKSGGILSGLKRIGIVLLDTILYPIQQLLKLLSKIPGLGKLAGKGSDFIVEMRKKMGLVQDSPEKQTKSQKTGTTKTEKAIEKLAENTAKMNSGNSKNSDLKAEMQLELSGGKKQGNSNSVTAIKERIKKLTDQRDLESIGSEKYRYLNDQIKKEQAKLPAKSSKTALDKSNSAVTGGQRSVVLNVQIDNVIKDVNQYVSNGKQAADDLVDEILDQLTRRLHGTFRTIAE